MNRILEGIKPGAFGGSIGVWASVDGKFYSGLIDVNRGTEFRSKDDEAELNREKIMEALEGLTKALELTLRKKGYFGGCECYEREEVERKLSQGITLCEKCHNPFLTYFVVGGKEIYEARNKADAKRYMEEDARAMAGGSFLEFTDRRMHVQGKRGRDII